MIYGQLKLSEPSKNHRWIDDAQAILIGTLTVSFGVFLYKSAGLLTGGVAGLSLLLSKVTSFSFGQMFFLLNLPFYYLAFKRMGIKFLGYTFVSIALVSFLSDHLGRMIQIQHINIYFAAVFGGTLMGLGILILFRHKASLGGFNILASYLQEHHGISAGKVQMLLDLGVLTASFFIIDTPLLIASILGTATMNLILATNHKPGRYMGMS